MSIFKVKYHRDNMYVKVAYDSFDNKRRYDDQLFLVLFISRDTISSATAEVLLEHTCSNCRPIVCSIHGICVNEKMSYFNMCRYYVSTNGEPSERHVMRSVLSYFSLNLPRYAVVAKNVV